MCDHDDVKLNIAYGSCSEIEPLQHSEKELLDLDNNDVLIALSRDHEKISKKSQEMLTKVVWVMFSFWITYSMRSNLVILYAETFYDNTSVISIFVYLSYISSAISSSIYGIVSDRWRVDYLLIIASIFDVLTFWLEATAPNFLVLGIAYSIGGQPFQAIAYAFNIKLIPTHYAQQIRGKMLQVSSVAAIIGPILGGIISYFYSYRTVFYCSAIISVCLFLYSLAVFYNVEESLINDQLTMKQSYIDNDINMYRYTEDTVDEMEEKHKWIISKDYRFPVCKESQESQESHQKVEGGIRSLLDLNKYRSLLLILFAIHGALISSGDFTIIAFYASYMQDRFNCNIIISTSQLSSYVLAYIIGNQTAKTLIKFIQSKKLVDDNNNNTRYDFDNLAIEICLFCLLIMLVCSSILLPLDIFSFGNDSIEIIIEYWIVMFIYGIVVGIGYLTIELICVRLIPNDVAGKITAIQIVTRMTIGGTMCLVVGILFDTSINYLWYTQAACQLIAMFILIIVASFETGQWYHV